ncbi:MAG: hypothetical protein NTZ78_04855 [Candidatus Aureabacteria bacterium]|nr:hypothetical protein [Candidatus Auribacterota bacterium]
MKFMQTEATSVGVPERAIKAEEIRARWSWVEPSVWTERMLTALEGGVKVSLPNMDCSPLQRPMRWPVNPLGGEPPTGEPCAGEPPARFGGGRGRAIDSSYPYQVS